VGRKKIIVHNIQTVGTDKKPCQNSTSQLPRLAKQEALMFSSKRRAALLTAHLYFG
jgi:hypothetical protein